MKIDEYCFILKNVYKIIICDISLRCINFNDSLLKELNIVVQCMGTFKDGGDKENSFHLLYCI